MQTEERGDGLLVLVAEDEAVTRMSLVLMLQEAGYATIEATSGPKTIQALEETPGIGLVLSDIDMPAGFDGITLAACVDHRWPDVGIILVSGKAKPRAGDLPSGARFFPKPYKECEMLSAISRAFQDRHSAIAYSQVT